VWVRNTAKALVVSVIKKLKKINLIA